MAFHAPDWMDLVVSVVSAALGWWARHTQKEGV